VNNKEKIKKIEFPLAIQKIDDINILKKENLELKARVSKLEHSIIDLKEQFDQKIHNIETNFTTLQNQKIKHFD
jgi:uncharacterized protein YdcH (DUF465 family)